MKRAPFKPSTKPMKRTPMTPTGMLRASIRIAPNVARATVKLRKCKHCRQPFTPSPPCALVCSPDCGLSLVRLKREKAERATAKGVRIADRERKEAIKTLTDHIADTQKVFNTYIRERDKSLPCICCGKFGGTWSRGGIWDAGHFRSRGSASHLRFDERNCHRQLKQRNSFGAGRHDDFRVGLIARIGLQAVEALEADQAIHRWTIDELKAIKATYRAKLKELQR